MGLRTAKQVLYGPNVVSQPRLHCRRDPQRRMHATEIVVREMQIHISPKIFQFPRKRIRQSGESAKLHPDGQVLPLYVAGGDVIGIGSG